MYNCIYTIHIYNIYTQTITNSNVHMHHITQAHSHINLLEYPIRSNQISDMVDLTTPAANK